MHGLNLAPKATLRVRKVGIGKVNETVRVTVLPLNQEFDIKITAN